MKFAGGAWRIAWQTLSSGSVRRGSRVFKCSMRINFFYIIERLAEAGGKTRGMRREHAPVPRVPFLVFSSVFRSPIHCSLFHFRRLSFPSFSFLLPISLSLSFTYTRSAVRLFVLHDTPVRRKRNVPKVLTLGHKIHRGTKDRHILSRPSWYLRVISIRESIINAFRTIRINRIVKGSLCSLEGIHCVCSM